VTDCVACLCRVPFVLHNAVSVGASVRCHLGGTERFKSTKGIHSSFVIVNNVVPVNVKNLWRC
jgi:hypothetical protein